MEPITTYPEHIIDLITSYDPLSCITMSYPTYLDQIAEESYHCIRYKD